jgi:hypothetical protein
MCVLLKGSGGVLAALMSWFYHRGEDLSLRLVVFVRALLVDRVAGAVLLAPPR